MSTIFMNESGDAGPGVFNPKQPVFTLATSQTH